MADMDDRATTTTTSSYYLRNSVINLDESPVTEFKGHRRLLDEEIAEPFHCEEPDAVDVKLQRPSRKPISRDLCGMLNSKTGGIIFIGVTDDGTVKGIMLSEHQKVHFLLSLQLTLSRFQPKVEDPDRVSVSFVPIVEDEDESDPEEPVPGPLQVNEELEHLLATCRHCWCDNDAAAAMGCGIFNPFYVIEVKVGPLTGRQLVSPPSFRAPNGVVYRRRFSSTVACMQGELIEEWTAPINEDDEYSASDKGSSSSAAGPAADQNM